MGMSGEKAYHKKEADKAKMETCNQTQKGGRSDEKAHHKKENEKVKMETWSQTQEVGMSDEETRDSLQYDIRSEWPQGYNMDALWRLGICH